MMPACAVSVFNSIDNAGPFFCRSEPPMKAMVLDAPGQLLQYRTVADPAPGPDQVLVKIAACGVCRTDLHVVDGGLTDPRLPIIPGNEIVGHAEALGAGVNRFTLGDRVASPGWATPVALTGAAVLIPEQ